MLSAEQEEEVKELARSLGEPLRRQRQYAITNERTADWLGRLTRRRGEAIFVVPRAGGRLLLHTKSTYPEGVYRFPGGGIEKRESVADAARREAKEELGVDLEPQRLLGVVDNVFVGFGREFHYPSYVFLLPPLLQEPQVLDPDEEIAGFSDVAPQDLPAIIAQLESLPDEWQPWGQFRATPHALAREALGYE